MSGTSDMSDTHDRMLDDVAVYALGVLNAPDAARVREHLRDCPQCQAEYQALASTAATVGASAEGPQPSDLLKARIMREVRAVAAAGDVASVERPSRAKVWPAYLVAAACFALAVGLSLVNLSLIEQLRTAQTQIAQTSQRSKGLAHDLSFERTTVADLMDEKARRYDVPGGQIVQVHDRLYITMHGMPQPPKGKVYQAWTLPKGSKTMQPSLTFLPDAHGVAVIALPVKADGTAAVAVSVEPEGGSKAPTSKPLVVQQLD